MKIKNRWYLLLGGLISAALVFSAACGSDDDDDPTPTGDTTPVATTGGGGGDDRIDGGEIVANGLEGESLDPHYSSAANDISFQRMIFRGLMTLDKDNKPQPGMAAAQPTISDDGLTYTYKLREGLLWSDGEPLTAEDFEYGFKRVCNPVNLGQYYATLGAIVGCTAHYDSGAFSQAMEDAIGVNAIDATTLEIKLSQPQATFVTITSLWLTFPAPKHLFQTTSDPWPKDVNAMVYNGPYKLTEYVLADHMTFVPNENWAAPAGVSPTLDKITVRFVDSANTANDAYSRGELQFALADTSQLTTVKSTFGDEYMRGVLAATRGLHFQMVNETLADLDVRMALSRAINRDQLAEVVTQGAHEATTSWIPPDVSGAEEGAFDDIIGFDEAAAKEHLATAGYPDGAGFPELSILTRDDPLQRGIAEYLQQNFKDILNINVGIEVVASADRAKRRDDSRAAVGPPQYEMLLGGWVQDYPDPENWILGLFETNGGNNHYNCSLPELDSKLEQALSDQNDEERRQLYRDIEELLVTNLCGMAPYYSEFNHFLIKPNIIGMRENSGVQDAVIAGDWNAEAWGLSE